MGIDRHLLPLAIEERLTTYGKQDAKNTSLSSG